MIRFDAVTKQFPDGTVAVDELSLTAPTGQITVLVGPSGCGKTTSLRMVNRMVEPTRGSITLDGQDTGRMNEAELRRGMGYVIQHAGLFPHRTVLDNIGTVPRLLGWDRRAIRERSHELLERVGLAPELGDRYPAQLSGGQQQRVGVARALAADPPVMLMDEPFSAVDPVVREQLQDEFLRLQEDLGKTIVFVTHDIDEAIKLGEQVAVLRVGGRLAQVAEPAYLLAHPVDDFVADFMGRDRGYRALQFQETPRLPLRSEPTVVIGETPESDAAWILVVDDDRRPLGWVEPKRIGGRPVTRADLHRGGTVAHEHGSLREALDAALSSPSRRGVIVDSSGALSGTVLAHEVLTAIEEAERPERDESAPRQGGTANGGSGDGGAREGGVRDGDAGEGVT
jgi:osmoprotectant transport system ATP-binding protein